MFFNLPNETITVRGIVIDADSPARLWVDDTEFLPESIRNEFNTYCLEFTWGYSGAGSTFTALAVSYGIFGEKHIAKSLASLIEKQFVVDWPFRQSFSQEINLIDFWTHNQDAIEKAEEQANQSREWGALDVRLQTKLAQYKLVEKPFSIRPEQAPLRVIYGPSAEVHWLKFPTANPNIQGRCRVDLYPLSSLVILTDIEEYSVEHFIEGIIFIISNRFGINLTKMTVIQLYQHDPDLICRVSFSYQPSPALITDPEWSVVSQANFQRLINYHEHIARRLPRWLAPVAGWLLRVLNTDARS